MGVITPLSEQLTKPLPNAIALVNLKELSTGAYKLLPEGIVSHNFSIMRYATSKYLLCFIAFLFAKLRNAFDFSGKICYPC